MAKAYWVVCYRLISDPTAREKYSKLGGPAVLAAGGRFLTRSVPAKTYEHGIKEHTVNRQRIGTPYRHPKGTPFGGESGR